MRIVLDCFCLIICYFLEILNLNRPFAVCNRYFWDLSLKIYSLATFNMLFQFVRTKFFKSKLLACLPESWSRGQLMQKAYYNWTAEVHKNQSSLISPSCSYSNVQFRSRYPVSKKIRLEQYLAKALRAEVIAHQGGYAFKGFFFLLLTFRQ